MDRFWLKVAGCFLFLAVTWFGWFWLVTEAKGLWA